MANTKISALTAGAPAVATDLIPIDRAGANYSLQVSDMQTALNGAAIPASKTIVGTNGSSQIVDASAATLSNNTSGTAANLSGTPALPNGTTATTQAAFDNSGSLSTDAYADNNFKGVSVTGFRDDFLNCSVAGATISTTRATVFGDTPWTAASVAGATNTFTAVTSSFTNPGQAELTTLATVGDGLYIAKSNGASGGFGALGSNAGWETNFVFKLAQTTNVCIRMGFTNNPASDTDGTGISGMFVEYDSANASSDTDFTWVTAATGTATYATTNSKAVDTAFHHVRIRSTVAGTIGFTIDGGTEFTTTTTVTAVANLGLWFQIINRTTNTAVSLILDFASYMAATGRT